MPRAARAMAVLVHNDLRQGTVPATLMGPGWQHSKPGAMGFSINCQLMPPSLVGQAKALPPPRRRRSALLPWAPGGNSRNRGIKRVFSEFVAQPSFFLRSCLWAFSSPRQAGERKSAGGGRVAASAAEQGAGGAASSRHRGCASEVPKIGGKCPAGRAGRLLPGCSPRLVQRAAAGSEDCGRLLEPDPGERAARSPRISWCRHAWGCTGHHYAASEGLPSAAPAERRRVQHGAGRRGHSEWEIPRKRGGLQHSLASLPTLGWSALFQLWGGYAERGRLHDSAGSRRASGAQGAGGGTQLMENVTVHWPRSIGCWMAQDTRADFLGLAHAGHSRATHARATRLPSPPARAKQRWPSPRTTPTTTRTSRRTGTVSSAPGWEPRSRLRAYVPHPNCPLANSPHPTHAQYRCHIHPTQAPYGS